MDTQEFFNLLLQYWHIIVTQNICRSNIPPTSIRSLLKYGIVSFTDISRVFELKGIKITPEEASKFMNNLVASGELVSKSLARLLSPENLKKAYILHKVDVSDRDIDYDTEFRLPIIRPTEFLKSIIENWDAITVTYVYKKKIDIDTISAIGISLRDDVFRFFKDQNEEFTMLDGRRLLDILVKEKEMHRRCGKYYLSIKNREKCKIIYSQLEISAKTYDTRIVRKEVEDVLKNLYKIQNRLKYADRGELYTLLEWIVKSFVQSSELIDIGIPMQVINSLNDYKKRYLTQQIMEIAKSDDKAKLVEFMSKIKNGDIKVDDAAEIVLPDEIYKGKEVVFEPLDAEQRFSKFEGKNIARSLGLPNFMLSNEKLMEYYEKATNVRKDLYLRASKTIDDCQKGIPLVDQSILQNAMMRFYLLSTETKFLVGMQTDQIAASLLHYELKETNIPSSLNEFAKKLDIKHAQLNNTYMKILTNFKLPSKNISLKDASNWIFNVFNFNEKEKAKYKKITNFLRRIGIMGVPSDIIESINGYINLPISGIIYYIKIMCDDEKMSQDQISASLGITQVSLRKYYQDLDHLIRKYTNIYDQCGGDQFE